MNEREIFQAALDCSDVAKRQAYLEQACGMDTALRARIDALLSSHATISTFLNVPFLGQLNSPAKEQGNFGSGRDGGDADSDSPTVPDLSFLQPSSKPGSIGTLGSYEILEVLGQGAFGIVFKAFDEKLCRLVAIKVMNPQLAGTSPPRKRFLREARSAAAIRHENIVQVHTVEEEPLPYLVMEYIDGETLQQKLNSTGPLDPLELLHLGRQMASGLAAAHAQGLIHRDIKPGNILLEWGAEQKVKITDFGLARTVDDASMTRTGFISGTPLYMAPEQAQGLALDHRGDLFSLGSVLYQMASGRAPFRASSAIAVLKRVIEEQPRPIRDIIPEVPGWLCAIISRLHAKKPEDRFASAAEVAQLLGHCLSEMQLHGNVESIGDALPVIQKPAGTVQDTAWKERAKISKSSAGNSPRLWWAVAAAAAAAAVIVMLIGLAAAIDRNRGKTVVGNPLAQLIAAPIPVAGDVDTGDVERRDADRRAAAYALSVGAKVRIHHNEREDPFEVQTLPNEDFMLAEVDFHGNTQVTNAALACFAKCRDLRMFGIGNTAVTDVGLGYLKNCTQLESIALNAPGVTDAGLLHFAGCKNLKRVWLGGSQISDRGLIMFKGNKTLLEFMVGGAAITSAGLENLADAKDLEVLVIASAFNVDSQACAIFKDFKKLKILRLRATNVDDTGVRQFVGCKDLIELEVNTSPATGAVISLLDQWPKLQLLTLANTAITDDQLARLKMGNPLTELRLISSGFTDAGIKNIARCTELEGLWLLNSHLTDASLESLAGLGLEKLRWLKLDGGSPGITAAGVNKLAEALPDCKIEWDGGTVIPLTGAPH